MILLLYQKENIDRASIALEATNQERKDHAQSVDQKTLDLFKNYVYFLEKNEPDSEVVASALASQSSGFAELYKELNDRVNFALNKEPSRAGDQGFRRTLEITFGREMLDEKKPVNPEPDTTLLDSQDTSLHLKALENAITSISNDFDLARAVKKIFSEADTNDQTKISRKYWAFEKQKVQARARQVNNFDDFNSVNSIYLRAKTGQIGATNADVEEISNTFWSGQTELAPMIINKPNGYTEVAMMLHWANFLGQSRIGSTPEIRNELGKILLKHSKSSIKDYTDVREGYEITTDLKINNQERLVGTAWYDEKEEKPIKFDGQWFDVELIPHSTGIFTFQLYLKNDTSQPFPKSDEIVKLGKLFEMTLGDNKDNARAVINNPYFLIVIKYILHRKFDLRKAASNKVKEILQAVRENHAMIGSSLLEKYLKSKVQTPNAAYMQEGVDQFIQYVQFLALLRHSDATIIFNTEGELKEIYQYNDQCISLLSKFYQRVIVVINRVGMPGITPKALIAIGKTILIENHLPNNDLVMPKIASSAAMTAKEWIVDQDRFLSLIKEGKLQEAKGVYQKLKDDLKPPFDRMQLAALFAFYKKRLLELANARQNSPRSRMKSKLNAAMTSQKMKDTVPLETGSLGEFDQNPAKFRYAAAKTLLIRLKKEVTLYLNKKGKAYTENFVWNQILVKLEDYKNEISPNSRHDFSKVDQGVKDFFKRRKGIVVEGSKYELPCVIIAITAVELILVEPENVDQILDRMNDATAFKINSEAMTVQQIDELDTLRSDDPKTVDTKNITDDPEYEFGFEVRTHVTFFIFASDSKSPNGPTIEIRDGRPNGIDYVEKVKGLSIEELSDWRAILKAVVEQEKSKNKVIPASHLESNGIHFTSSLTALKNRLSNIDILNDNNYRLLVDVFEGNDEALQKLRKLKELKNTPENEDELWKFLNQYEDYLLTYNKVSLRLWKIILALHQHNDNDRMRNQHNVSSRPLTPKEELQKKYLNAVRGYQQKPPDQASIAKGGIDLNSANLNLQIIERDGRGVPLPLSQQDIAQLSRIQGFEAQIIEIQPALNLPILSELQQKLHSS